MSRVNTAKVVIVCSFILSFMLYWLVGSFFEVRNFHDVDLPHISYQSTSHDKWIVITTILPPTNDVEFLASIPGWRVVVVGDSKTPTDLYYVNCTFLSLKNQRYLPFEIVKLIPTDSYARKTIGYLYAIANGAKVIYETIDVSRPLDNLNNFNLKPITYGIRFAGERVFNPYHHFGQPSLWPRGYPLDKIGSVDKVIYRIGSFKTPYIQQGMFNGDPDMDALFHLTRKSTASILNVTFDSVAPNVIVPSGVISPFNSQNTLFLYNALWAMVIPTTTSFRICDIWRGYWAQRLLWEIGGTLGFYPPNEFQLSNSHNYTNDSKDEQIIYLRASELVTFLQEWRCSSKFRFFQCVESLSQEMFERKFWKEKDVILIKTWLKDLLRVGYLEPLRQEYALSVYAKSNNFTTVLYQPTEQIFPRIHQSKNILRSKWDQIRGIMSFCNQTSFSLSRSSLSSITYPNILLIIVFNFPIYDNIPYLQLMYGVTFSHIIYCGDTIKAFEKASEKFPKPVTFMEVDVNRGYYGYRCVLESMKMNFNVRGYLLIGDDTLLNSWNIPKLPFEKLWFHHASILYRDKPNPWHWWNGVMGRLAFIKAWEKLLSISNEDPSRRRMISSFMNNLADNTRSKLGLYSGPSDIVFIPHKYKDDVIFIMEIFSKYGIFLEVTIPTVIFGLETHTNILTLSGQYLWYDGKRDHVPELFNASKVFLHPVKLSLITTTLKSFFCLNYFPLTLRVN